MALSGWPYTALYDTFVALKPIPSAFLNSVQEMIRDMFERHTRIECGFNCADNAGQATWELHPGTPEYGAICLVGSGVLRIDIASRRHFYVESVKVKVYNSAAATIIADLYRVNAQFTVSATAPTTALEASANATAAGAWEIITLTPAADIELAANEHLIVVITIATPNDIVAGVEVTCNARKAV